MNRLQPGCNPVFLRMADSIVYLYPQVGEFAGRIRSSSPLTGVGGTKGLAVATATGGYIWPSWFALFATDRRHFKPDERAFPRVIEDLQAAVRCVRSHAAELNLDPQRIAVMGASSGGYIAVLVGDMLMGQKAGGESPATSCTVKSVIAVYGVFDLAAEWNF
jgi:hypothetical protein